MMRIFTIVHFFVREKIRETPTAGASKEPHSTGKIIDRISLDERYPFSVQPSL
jgi:hypothetical protein